MEDLPLPHCPPSFSLSMHLGRPCISFGEPSCLIILQLAPGLRISGHRGKYLSSLLSVVFLLSVLLFDLPSGKLSKEDREDQPSKMDTSGGYIIQISQLASEAPLLSLSKGVSDCANIE